jgi:hypothetical protein
VVTVGVPVGTVVVTVGVPVGTVVVTVGVLVGAAVVTVGAAVLSRHRVSEPGVPTSPAGQLHA